MPIAFHYQASHFRIQNKKKVVEWLLTVAFIENSEVEQLDIVFCSDSFILSLNKKFLEHNTYTDIITFDYSSDAVISAEIYISINRIKENAISYGCSFNDELNRVIVHGLLHCIGYSDKTPALRGKMRRKEDEYLKLKRDMY